jgi:hypothetical protein
MAKITPTKRNANPRVRPKFSKTFSFDFDKVFDKFVAYSITLALYV